MSIRGFCRTTGCSVPVEALLQRLSINPNDSVSASSQTATGMCHATDSGLHSIAIDGSPRLISEPDREVNAAAILDLVTRRGENGFRDLCGSYALAIVDRAKATAWLAVDRIGAGRLTFAGEQGLLVFGTSADTVAGAMSRPKSISNQRLYDFLFFHMIPAPETVFEGVHKLEPGTCARWQDGKLEIKRYWRPAFAPDLACSEGQLAEELLEALESAVRATAPGDTSGAFLSGGLDSSTVAGMLQRVRGGAQTFSIGFGEPGYDELEFARCANEHFGCSGHEYNVTPEDVLAAFSEIAQAYDEPFGNSSAVPVLACARFAREHGIDHLLAGDGGDELFAGNERYAKQKLFEAYTLLPVHLRRHLLEPLVRPFDTATAIAPLRKLKSYLDQANTPLPERLETWNFVYREGMQTMLNPDFAREIDLQAPVSQMNGIYAAAETDDYLDRMLAYDWHITLADSDLRKVSTMCDLAGVRVSYPMLDHRLIELALRIPPKMKLRRLELRSFFKRATRGFLPQKILTKPKHGFGLPFGRWMKSEPRLAEMIYERLYALRQRRIFRDEFIDEIIRQQQTGHHAYYGFFLWDLAMLEEWLTHHA